MLKSYELLTKKDMDKIEQSKEPFKIKCSCGARNIVVDTDRKICYRCGRWVYKNEKIKFKYEILKRLREAKANGY